MSEKEGGEVKRVSQMRDGDETVCHELRLIMAITTYLVKTTRSNLFLTYTLTSFSTLDYSPTPDKLNS